MWRTGNQEKEWSLPATFSGMESAQRQGNSIPPGTLYRGCPRRHGTLHFPLTVSGINTQLISHSFQDLRLSARGLPVHMERWLLSGERFWGLPVQLAGSGMVVRGLERFSHGKQQAVTSLLLFLSPSPLNAAAGSKGLKGTAGRE